MRAPGPGLRYVAREAVTEFVAPQGEAQPLFVASAVEADPLSGWMRIDPDVIARLERLEAKLDRLIAWMDAAEE